ncbi:MAG TPA: flavin reductase family protein [Anaeromyxobacteraceae bacterium]|nr:flavin reductase family protein [Anaeromyxobacteraceae bacterium]
MRVPLELRRSYRLLNHGPVVLVSAAAGGVDNLMPVAWSAPLDFEPARVALVLSAESRTRELIEASGELAISVPPASMLDALYEAGHVSGHDVDKWARCGFERLRADRVKAPLVAGCLAWLECQVIDRSLAAPYDLFVCEVVAASVDDACFRGGEWVFPDDARTTVHHMSAGSFFLTGRPVKAAGSPPAR